MIAVRYASDFSGVLVRSTIQALIHPIASASTALPAANTSEFALVAMKWRLPSTASKLASRGAQRLPLEERMVIPRSG